MSKKNMGSSIDDFLKQEGMFEEAQAQAVKEVVAWQLAEAMRTKKISKARMATLLKTSRTQGDRLLDPKNDITLSSVLSRLRFDKGRKSAIRGSRADEGVCPTLTLPRTVKNYPGQETSLQRAAAMVGRRVTIELV
jgi:antitoxin HicB